MYIDPWYGNVLQVLTQALLSCQNVTIGEMIVKLLQLAALR